MDDDTPMEEPPSCEEIPYHTRVHVGVWFTRPNISYLASMLCQGWKQRIIYGNRNIMEYILLHCWET